MIDRINKYMDENKIQVTFIEAIRKATTDVLENYKDAIKNKRMVFDDVFPQLMDALAVTCFLSLKNIVKGAAPYEMSIEEILAAFNERLLCMHTRHKEWG